MQKRQRTLALIVALAVVLMLAGCTQHREPVTIWSSDTLVIDRQGKTLYVRDLTGGTTYTLGTKRVRKTGQEAQEAKSLVNTDTIRIETARRVVIVTDKTAGQTVYIQR